MRLWDAAEARRAEAIAGLVTCNPFLPERIERERAVLGAEFDERTAAWNVHPDWQDEPPNVARLVTLGERLVAQARGRLDQGAQPGTAERALFEDLALFVLYHRHRPQLHAAVNGSDGARPALRLIWGRFLADARRLFARPWPAPPERDVAHLFAGCVQVCRAFHNVFQWIVGVSQPAVRLRAAIWQSIFTHDMRRYRRVLFDRMADYTTLVTGPSGTGKELVARAVALSRYLPFDPEREQLADAGDASFTTLNLSALSATLIESELFGHKRGAFTGAVADRKGWLEVCPPLGCVLLDEIGELDLSIQVKLLRVLEDRRFSRVGDTRELRFRGKLVAATNRDLAEEMREGRFRTDLYYRLCADRIEMPTLFERIQDDPAERRHLVEFLARRLLGAEFAGLADEVETWIDRHLGPDYAWPGNVRELEQCVRNILVRREYRPARPRGGDGRRDAFDELAERMRAHAISADELVARYCALVHGQSAGYQDTARKVGLDRRTVRAKVEAAR
jgi:transcriptional regulator with AAA-type ATPase domain